MNAPIEIPLRLDEAFKLFPVCEKTVRRLIWKGKLPAFKIGGRWFIWEREIKKFYELQTTRYGGGQP
jgi:excisionase family DNA binding protein